MGGTGTGSYLWFISETLSPSPDLVPLRGVPVLNSPEGFESLIPFIIKLRYKFL